MSTFVPLRVKVTAQVDGNRHVSQTHFMNLNSERRNAITTYEGRLSLQGSSASWLQRLDCILCGSSCCHCCLLYGRFVPSALSIPQQFSLKTEAIPLVLLCYSSLKSSALTSDSFYS